MVLRSCALLTPFRQGASHRRKVRDAFVLCLARPRKVLFFEWNLVRGLASFFWMTNAAQSHRTSKALALQKNVNLLLLWKTFTPDASRGEVAPRRCGLKTKQGGNERWSFVLMASVGMCEPGRRTERSVGRLTLSFTPIFNRQHSARGRVLDVWLLNIRLLCNPAA